MTANPWALGSVALVVGLQVLAVHFRPLGEVLRTVPLDATDWLVVATASVVPGVVGQAWDSLRARRG